MLAVHLGWLGGHLRQGISQIVRDHNWDKLDSSVEILEEWFCDLRNL